MISNIVILALSIAAAVLADPVCLNPPGADPKAVSNLLSLHLPVVGGTNTPYSGFYTPNPNPTAIPTALNLVLEAPAVVDRTLLEIWFGPETVTNPLCSIGAPNPASYSSTWLGQPSDCINLVTATIAWDDLHRFCGLNTVIGADSDHQRYQGSVWISFLEVVNASNLPNRTVVQELKFQLDLATAVTTTPTSINVFAAPLLKATVVDVDLSFVAGTPGSDAIFVSIWTSLQSQFALSADVQTGLGYEAFGPSVQLSLAGGSFGSVATGTFVGAGSQVGSSTVQISNFSFATTDCVATTASLSVTWWAYCTNASSCPIVSGEAQNVTAVIYFTIPNMCPSVVATSSASGTAKSYITDDVFTAKGAESTAFFIGKNVWFEVTLTTDVPAKEADLQNITYTVGTDPSVHTVFVKNLSNNAAVLINHIETSPMQPVIHIKLDGTTFGTALSTFETINWSFSYLLSYEGARRSTGAVSTADKIVRVQARIHYTGGVDRSAASSLVPWF